MAALTNYTSQASKCFSQSPWRVNG
uniref:Uncharacterized protein n=1 Tax=Anguilla anguilla TaxID=7936 RepID=A0A0E9Y276_ANGAN